MANLRHHVLLLIEYYRHFSHLAACWEQWLCHPRVRSGCSPDLQHCILSGIIAIDYAAFCRILSAVGSAMMAVPP